MNGLVLVESTACTGYMTAKELSRRCVSLEPHSGMRNWGEIPFKNRKHLVLVKKNYSSLNVVVNINC